MDSFYRLESLFFRNTLIKITMRLLRNFLVILNLKQWKSIIAKTSENKDGDVGKAKKAEPLDFPSGMKMQDLTGLHIELLNMLPQKKYTHYTLNQLFLENRTIYDSLFDTFVALDPMEHDTLQVLDKIVKRVTHWYPIGSNTEGPKSIVPVIKHQVGLGHAGSSKSIHAGQVLFPVSPTLNSVVVEVI